jgi:hypothetical protein
MAGRLSLPVGFDLCVYPYICWSGNQRLSIWAAPYLSTVRLSKVIGFLHGNLHPKPIIINLVIHLEFDFPINGCLELEYDDCLGL